MKKVLVTWANGMLATDFIKHNADKFEIIACDKSMLDITHLSQIRTVIASQMPDLVLNCAAYTNVDESEDSGKKVCFDINTLWVYNLARITGELGIDFITISTDYVFDGQKRELCDEHDECHPLGNYGLSKYLGETLARSENPETIIVRTSWLYGGWKIFKNFVNTMIRFSETRSEIKVVNDQFGSPTYTGDLAEALGRIIEHADSYRGSIFHLSNNSHWHGVTWFDFATEIFSLTGKKIDIIPCLSLEFPSKAIRPKYSKLRNHSDIVLRDWKDWLKDYIKENY